MKFWYNPNFLAAFFFSVFSFFALKSLFLPGFYSSHDGETHVARIAQYYRALSDGQIPPRIAPAFYNGIGSPIFVYIYPLPYLLGSVVHFFGFTFVDAFKVLMILAFLFSGVGAYLLFREIFESSRAGFLGAVFYTWASYRLQLVYVRASISELLAYSLLPLVFWGIMKVSEKGTSRWIGLTALFFSLVLLSQNLVALISIPVLIIYAILFSKRNTSLGYWSKVAACLFLGFLISSFVYWPAIFERAFVHFSILINEQFSHHFVTLSQLLYSPWGYGFDLAGTVNDEMSLQIGLAHLLILIVLLFTFLYFFLIKRNLTKIPRQHLNFICMFILVIVVSLSFMTESKLSVYFFKYLGLSKIIDIPWRLLGIVVFSISFVAAFVAKYLRPGLFFLLLVLATLIANRNHLRINEQVFFDDEHFLNYRGTATQYSEFSPIWRDLKPPASIDGRRVAEFFRGEGTAEIMVAKSNKYFLRVDVESDNAVLRINKIYFPGVSVNANGHELKAYSDYDVPTGGDPDGTGLMFLNLEKGINKIDILYGESNLRKAADVVSVLGLIFVLGLIVLNPQNAKLFKK